MKNLLLVLFFLLIFTHRLVAQSISLTPGSSGNVSLPVLTNSQITAISSPQVGMMVFDKTYSVVRVFDGLTWTCTTCPTQPYRSLQLANIKSFTLSQVSGGGYTSSNIRDFNPADNAIGDVRTTASSTLVNNGFLLDNQDVIVFEQTLPSTIAGLTMQELLNAISQAQWTNPFIYNQPIDISVRSDNTNLIYLVREAGSYERQQGVVLGLRAYRFKNKIYTEKYASFVTLLDKLVKDNTTVNLASGMGITNLESYNIISTSPWFVVNSSGILSFPRTTNKPVNNYGIIYFLAKSPNLPTYRMRIYSVRPSQTTINQYFDANGDIIDRATYVNNYLLPEIDRTVPFELYMTGTQIRVSGAGRVPPPTATTEDTIN